MSRRVNPPPPIVGSARVVLWASLDAPLASDDAHRRIAGRLADGPVVALAICVCEDGCFLFRCNASWQVVADTWHASLEEARGQAEFEHEGLALNWTASNGEAGAR